MKTITIKIPEALYAILQDASAAVDLTPEEFATDMIAHGLLCREEDVCDSIRSTSSPKRPRAPVPQAPFDRATWQGEPHRGDVIPEFKVGDVFSDRPPATIEWTQRFVDSALSYVGVTAFPNGEGIGFDPNFVFIEYVYKEEIGFAASFYGTCDEFAAFAIAVEPGRSRSYSRLKVKGREDLDIAVKALHISAHLKGMNRRG